MFRCFIFILLLSTCSFSYTKPILKFGLPTPVGSKDSLLNKKLISTIFEKLGYKCSFETLPVERGSQYILSGDIDGIPGKPVEEFINFPNIPIIQEPYLEIPFKVYYKNKIISNITWGELEKFKCVNIIGVNIVNQKMPVATQNGNLYGVASYIQAVKMVDAGRVDFAILIEPIADNVIKKENITTVKKFDTVLISTPIYMLLSRKHKDLAPKAAEVLKQMKKDGSYYKILDEFK